MKKILLTTMLLAGLVSFGQNCSYGTVSEKTSNGGNISTGGAFEYFSASDFDIPFGTVFTVNQVQLNVLKGEADLEYVHVRFLEDDNGKPGEPFQTFLNLVPTKQELAYVSTIEGMNAYTITVDLPTTFELAKGKYYLDIQGAPGDNVAVSWEITTEDTTSVGRFDFNKFGTDPWFGGFSYYDNVFQVIGTCADSGEEQPDYGDECSQGNESNEYETGLNLRGGRVADDFIVPANTTFYLSDLKMATLQLGNIVNAGISIRNSIDGRPGEVIYTAQNISPKTENFFGYHPFAGFPLDVVSVVLEFEFEEPFELTAGHYFIEIHDVVNFPFTDFLAWEATSLPGIGGNAFESFDGETWKEANGLNLVFDVSGFCKETLGVNDLEKTDFNFYPNPVKDELNIISKSDVKNVSIYNVSGQSVMNSKSKKINTSALPKGVYIVRAKLANGQIETFKIVKK